MSKENKNWKDIDRLLTTEYQNQWESQGFTWEQTWDWIRSVGMKVEDAYYCAWLRDVKNKDSEWVLNYGQNEELREEYQAWKIKKLESLNAPTHRPSAFAWKPLLIKTLILGTIIYLLTKNYE